MGILPFLARRREGAVELLDELHANIREVQERLQKIGDYNPPDPFDALVSFYQGIEPLTAPPPIGFNYRDFEVHWGRKSDRTAYEIRQAVQLMRTDLLRFSATHPRIRLLPGKTASANSIYVRGQPISFWQQENDTEEHRKERRHARRCASDAVASGISSLDKRFESVIRATKHH